MPGYLSTTIERNVLRNLEDGVENVGNRLKAAAEELLEAGIETEMELFFTVDAFGGKDSSMNIFGAEAVIPIGGIVKATSDFLSPTIEGMSKILGDLLADHVLTNENPPEWDDLYEAATKLAEGTYFRFSTSTPLFVQIVLDAPATPLLHAAGSAGELLRSALACMVNSAITGSLAEFRTDNILERLIAAADGLRDLTLGLRFTMGAYGELGAEFYAGAGFGLSVSLDSNVEMLLLFANGSWDSPDHIGEATYNFSMNVSAEGGVSLGEAVEVKAGVGGELSTNLLTVRATEYDGGVPPLLYTTPGSSSADLQTLTLTSQGYDGTNQTFNAKYVSDSRSLTGGYYEIWAPSSISGSNFITLRATAFSSLADVTIMKYGYGDYSPNGRGEAVYGYSLPSGGRVDFDVRIVSYDGKNAQNYPVVVKSAPNLQLNKLEIGTGTLSPQFNSRVSRYTLTLGCDVNEVTIKPTLVEKNNTMLEINGVVWSSDKPYTLKGIPYGESDLTIKVKFPNSAADRRLTENVYYIRVIRAKSSNTRLRNLELNRKELANHSWIPLDFSPENKNYHVTVETDVAGINVIAAVADERARLRLGTGNPPDGNEPGVLSIDRLVPLQYGLNRLYLEVTAQDGTKETYTVEITRKKYQLNTLSIEAERQTLNLTQGQTSTQGFNPDIYNYVVRVPGGSSNNWIEFKTELQHAEVYYYDSVSRRLTRMRNELSIVSREGLNQYRYAFDALPSGNDWEAKLIVTVSDDTGKGSVYVITLLPESKPLEEGAELNGLTYKTGINGQARSLDISRKNISLEVDETVSDIYLSPSLKNAGDTVIINGMLYKNLDHKVAVEQGLNLIDVTVISKHSAVEQYTLSVFRKRTPAFNSFATEIQAEDFTLSPSFNQMFRTYSIEVPYEKTSVRIAVKTESPLASVGTWMKDGDLMKWSAYPKEGEYFVYDATALQVGRNTIPLIVQPRYGESSQYELVINRLPSGDASLKAGDGLSLRKIEEDPVTGEEKQNLVLDIGFDPDITDYTVTVPNQFNCILLKAVAAKDSEGASVAYEAGEIAKRQDGWYIMPLFEEKNLTSDGEFPVKARENPLTITVTAPDGVTKKTYNITIIRDLPPDTEKPSLIMPLDMRVEGNTLGGANVAFVVRATDARDGFLKPDPQTPGEDPLTVSLPDGITGTFEWEDYKLICRAFFPLQKDPYIIRCEARDKAGNVCQGSFRINIVDTTPPVLSGVPSRLELQATSAHWTAVTVPDTITATDIVDGDCEVFFIPELVPMFGTFGSFVAYDKSGNRSMNTTLVNVTDTIPPEVTVSDYVISTDQDEVEITDWDDFLKNNVTVTDNTGVRWEIVTTSELMYSSNSIRPTLKAGTETLFRYICRDHGLNMAAADFFVRVKYTVPEAPVARKPEEVKSILYPEDAWDPILLDASSLATDRNMDELSVVSVSAGTGSSVAEVEIVDSMLKITPRAPGRTNITVLISDGIHNVPVEIPVKVYDESEEMKAPYLIYDQPVKIKAGETIQLPIEDLVADENDEFLYFHDEDPCFTWSPDLLEPSIHGRNLVIKALNPGKGNVYFKVKDGRLDAVFHIRVTVNSLPEMVPEIEKVSPQLTKIADMELDAEIATGSELRIKVADIFRDVDMDDVLSFRNPASSASGIAAVSLDGNDLVIEGVQEGVANITVEVYDGM